MNNQTFDINDIKSANRVRGLHFFDPSTLRFFRSRVHPQVYQGPGGVYFVTSEQFVSSKGWADKREFTIRQFHPETGRCDTFGGFQAFASRSGAHAAAERASIKSEEGAVV